MPITIQNKQFTDSFGNNLSFYQSNAGDRVVATIDLKSTISVITGGSVYLTLNPVGNIITWTSGDFEAEGFRNGDTIVCRKFTSGGSAIALWVTNVENVNGSTMDITACPTWIDPALGEIIEMMVIGFGSGYHRREGLILDVNHVQNGTAGSEFSLIDADVTRFSFDLTTMNGSGTQSGVPIANRSGQFIENCRITDRTIAVAGTNNSHIRYYRIEVVYLNSGIYKSTNFDYANCLKFYAKMRFQSILGEPFDNLIEIVNDDADTGWFDQAFNLGTIDSALVQGITELAFDSQTNGQFVIDGSAPFGIGASYIPDDETYYKNRTFTQTELGMTIGTTQTSGFPLTFVSPSNDVGAFYTLLINNITSVGSQHTIDFSFIPDGNFTSFMQSRDDGDRLFRVWARIGDVNWLLFNDQLISNPPIAGALKMHTTGYLDHSENVQSTAGTSNGYEANIEDDLAFVGKFLIKYDQICGSFNAKIEAWNSSTDDRFTLQSAFFDIGSVPMVAGKYILNEIQPVNSALPTTSAKRECILALDPLIDDVDKYGVRIYFPFLFHWETWIQQLNANVDFYPNDQTKNWLPYGTTSDWSLRLRLELVRDGLQYVYNDPITIKPYDSDPNIDQTIELRIDATDQIVGVVAEGQLMRVVGYHELVDGSQWDQNAVWGMITIEPTESSPRWICSSVVAFDNNINNPLTPMSTLYCDMTFPSPNIARLECFFDPTKIDLSNGVKFTTKIKGCLKGGIGKQKSDGTIKQKSDGTIKSKANN